MNKDAPDTLEAASEALRESLFHYEPSYGNGDPKETAEIVIAADRKALRDAGYVVAPIVKISDTQLYEIRLLLGQARENEAVEYLQSLGLPIEMETE